MSRPVPNPGILDIAPYTPGKTPVPEPGRKVFKLSANETPFGPSPKAREVYQQAAAHLEDYPEGTSRVLREAIGRAYGLDPNRIICGAGSDEILNLLAHTYLSQGDEAISTAHGFLVYPIATMANGAKNVVAPEINFTADVDAILARVTPKTKLVWLANPNNPTGTYVPFDEVKRLRVGLPPYVLLVLDAAYSDYVSRNDYELGLELVATTENTVMTHTFSKIHGLAALRIGWMFGPANIIDAVNRIRGPFNVSTPAMLAAVAAIEDTAHVQMSRTFTEHWRNWLTEEITKLVWLANPNNPTGTYLPFDEIKRLRADLPSHVLLVLDAAYSDYVSRNDYELGIELVATTDNTVVTHTFSKIHGLAALRIGWMFGPAHIVDAVNRIRGPFNVSTPAMLAAVAALEDTAHQQMSKVHNEKWVKLLTDEVTKLGLKVTPSVGNFILIHFPLSKGKTSVDADAFLTKRGLVLRALNNYGLPHALRMTIGTEEANRLVIDGLRDFMAGK